MGEIDYIKLYFVLARLIKFQSLNGCNFVIYNSILYISNLCISLKGCNIYAKFQIYGLNFKNWKPEIIERNKQNSKLSKF